jgi:hypothetical protein
MGDEMQIIDRLLTQKHPNMVTLHPGQTHPDVVALRNCLEFCGWPLSPVVMGQETTYDPALAKMVRAHQQDEGLKPDAIVGILTWANLQNQVAMEQPTEPRIKAGWVDRLNSLLNPAVFSKLGYFKNRSADTYYPEGPMRISRPKATPLALAGAMHYGTSHGMTCGHAQAFVATLLLLRGGTPDYQSARWCASGMNLDGAWPLRAGWIRSPKSNVTTATIAGLSKFQADGFVAKVRGFATQAGPGIELWKPFQAYQYVIVELPKHVIGRLGCTGNDGLFDPRTGLLLRAGSYRLAADGTTVTTGKQWTFREWRDSDAATAINLWGVVCPDGPEAGIPVRAYLEV